MFLPLIKYFTLFSIIYTFEYLINLLTESYIIKFCFIFIYIFLIKSKFLYSEFIFDLIIDLFGKKHDRIFSKIGKVENYVNNFITKNSGRFLGRLKKMANFFLMDMIRDLIFKKKVEDKDENKKRQKSKTTYHRNDKIDFLNVDEFHNITSNDERDS